MGTRPEVVKMAPVIRRLGGDRKNFAVRVCVTGQHRQLLDAMLDVFGIRPETDLDVMRPDQSLTGVLRAVLNGMDRVIGAVKPDLLLVQGDTTTVLGASLAAFHRKVPVGHVEAGLRSFDRSNPFPEEMNRVCVDQTSALLFAPTPSAKGHLIKEGFNPGAIYVTGNTAVDSLLWMAGRRHSFACKALRGLPVRGRLAVLTLHRRESFGAKLRGVLRALRRAAVRVPDVHWVYPVHPNPHVREAARSILRHPRFLLVPPLDYADFVHLMKRSDFIVTDSGGVQEEAPSLGKPVLVVRERTERTEVLGKGSVLVGTDPAAVVREVLRAAGGSRRPAARRNPFGDGRAAERIAESILFWAGRARRRPVDFR